MRDQLIDAARKFIYDLDHFPIEAVVKQIGNESDEILSLNEDDVLEKRFEYIGIGNKDDYRNLFIETSEGTVLAGIRHLGGNPEKPFVYMWPSFKINNLQGIISELKPYFKIFKPMHYHFWVRPDCNNYEVPILQQRFVARVNEMTKFNLPLKIPMDYYNWYSNQYKIFHETKPDYVDRIVVNPKEMMDECLSQNMLYQFEVDGELAGLIAGEKELFLGEVSVCIDEILIASNFRGKGYANKLLGSFINQIDAEFLTCYIDSDNIPSTKTAIKAGEKIFSQECAVKI